MTDSKGHAHDEKVDVGIRQDSHRQLIGVLGLVFPAALLFFAAVLPPEDLDPWPPLTSLSAYYHTGAAGVFVGVLFALAVALYTYGGYKRIAADGTSKLLRADRIVGKTGCAAAIAVALFPTKAPPPVPPPSWWHGWMWIAHNASAVVLFASFIAFALWLFPKSDRPKRDRGTSKTRRDRICIGAGIVMCVCVLWALSSWFTKASIFWPEAIATVAFAVSWLAKGSVHERIARLLGRSGARQHAV